MYWRPLCHVLTPPSKSAAQVCLSLLYYASRSSSDASISGCHWHVNTWLPIRIPKSYRSLPTCTVNIHSPHWTSIVASIVNSLLSPAIHTLLQPTFPPDNSISQLQQGVVTCDCWQGSIERSSGHKRLWTFPLLQVRGELFNLLHWVKRNGLSWVP